MIENIWFVDDDEDDCELFETVINSVLPSAAITYIHNGEVFMDSLKFTDQPDLIFLDINMPCKTGLDCLSEIRSYTQFSNLPIIIFSCSDEPKQISAAYEKGANLYFTKPSSYKEMETGIDTILRMSWNEPLQIKKKHKVNESFVPFKVS